MESPEDRRSETSAGDLSRSRGTRNQRSNRSFDKSFISEKSFRIPVGRYAMSRKEAATIIQKNYRRYRYRQDYLLIKNRGSQRQFLFKATVRGEKAPKIITCSLNIRANGQIISLNFTLSEIRSRKGQSINIDLTAYNLYDSSDMKDRVLRIIREALTAKDLLGAIRQAF